MTIVSNNDSNNHNSNNDSFYHLKQQTHLYGRSWYVTWYIYIYMIWYDIYIYSDNSGHDMIWDMDMISIYKYSRNVCIHTIVHLSLYWLTR